MPAGWPPRSHPGRRKTILSDHAQPPISRDGRKPTVVSKAQACRKCRRQRRAERAGSRVRHVPHATCQTPHAACACSRELTHGAAHDLHVVGRVARLLGGAAAVLAKHTNADGLVNHQAVPVPLHAPNRRSGRFQAGDGASPNGPKASRRQLGVWAWLCVQTWQGSGRLPLCQQSRDVSSAARHTQARLAPGEAAPTSRPAACSHLFERFELP